MTEDWDLKDRHVVQLPMVTVTWGAKRGVKWGRAERGVLSFATWGIFLCLLVMLASVALGVR